MINLEISAAEVAIQQKHSADYILHRRFDRIGRLVGDDAMKTLFQTHIMIVGVGGVGSWAAESLARSGVGKITLVDFDEVCITNANRQLHALQGMVGQKKVMVMAERLRKINPQMQVGAVAQFYNEENSDEIFSHKPDWILDCIDNITAKCHLLSRCKKENIKVISSMGAGSRMDPLQIKLTDLSKTSRDPLAQAVRKALRDNYGFPKVRGSFGIPCVYSDEALMTPEKLKYDKGEGFKCVCPQGQNDYHSCEKRSVIHGTASFITGSFGLAMSAYVVREITKNCIKTPESI